MTAPASTEHRELAHRTNDGIEVTLFWNPRSNGASIAILDTRSGEAFEFDIDGSAALDAFNHPYAYAATASARNPASARVAADRPKVGVER